MKIKDYRIIRASKYLFVEIETDTGIKGIGEAGAWYFLDGTIPVIEKFCKMLIGENPFKVEHHWQMMYRSAYFRGSVITSAISAIDIALWDIKGKALGVPVYELLGGKTRDRVRTYAPVFEFTAEKMAEGCKELQEKGFTAARLMITDEILNEPLDMKYSIYASRVSSAIEKVKQCRLAVGNDFDLCLEVHRSMSPAEAEAFAKGVESYHPMFIEDAIGPDNHHTMIELSKKASVPFATGERFISIQEFEMLMSKDSIRFVRPDVCVVGGITAAIKIANIAESHYAQVVPHNPLGPVCTAASLQLDAAISNFGIQEFPSFYERGNEYEMMKKPFEVECGCIIIPDAPGIGIELIDNIEEVFPPTNARQDMTANIAFDGSVKDF